MRFIFNDQKTNESDTIDVPNTHTGKINSSLNGYLLNRPVCLNKDADTITIYIPDNENEEEKKILGTWIKEVRKERHWTQTDLADITRLSPAYVSQTERGFLVPSKKAISSIISALLFWNNTSETTPQVQQATSTIDEPLIKQDIRKLVEILLSTDDYRRLELIKNTFVSIERIENEIDSNNLESGIDLLIKLAIGDFERDLKNLKHS